MVTKRFMCGICICWLKIDKDVVVPTSNPFSHLPIHLHSSQLPPADKTSFSAYLPIQAHPGKSNYRSDLVD